jgi:hypothetical protein
MSASKLAYYTEELSAWNVALDFYLGEALLLIQKLEAVIRGDSIEAVDEKINTHHRLLNHCAERFSTLRETIQQRQALLKTTTGDLTGVSETNQSVLRLNIKAAEKEYIDIKFDCYKFLSGLFSK